MRELAPTLLHRLAHWAEVQPASDAITFLVGGETPGPTLTFGGLHAAVGTVAEALVARGALPGDRALLAYPQGIDFLVAFLACQAAGVVAVPVALPRNPRTMERLAGVAADCEARWALTTASNLEDLKAGTGLAALGWVASDEVPAGVAGYPRALPAAGDLAFLQYTSGSTSAPRGVRVTHANVVANLESLQAAFQSGPQSVFLSWLPLFHDMGLIGVALHALYVGAPLILMSPLAFIQKPLRWPRAISRFRATITGGPNFAFELCAKRATPEVVAGLDLSSLEILFNGAEPIHASSLAAFAGAFAPAGLRPEAPYPCFGLAEATLFVSGPTLEATTVVIEREDGVRPLVGCGHSWPGHAIAIVDPETRQTQPDGAVGEIWFSGPSVADGYWAREALSAETFRAERSDAPGTGWLRTGDLGFLQAGELFVSGRIKDLIIIEGRNHYPQDIERTVELAHPGIRASGVAAFGVETGGQERLVVAAEVERGLDPAEDTVLREVLTEAIAALHDLRLTDLVLLRGKPLAKTSSGKIMRGVCREAYKAGTLAVAGAPA